MKGQWTRIKDLTTVGSSTFISSAIYGIFWLYLASFLGTEHYGEVNYYLSISVIATTFSFLGAESTIMVYATKNVKIIPVVLFLALISSLIAAISLFLLFHNVSVSLLIIGSVIFGLVNLVTLGRKKYRNFSIYVITQRIILIPISLALYMVMGPNGIILGLAIASLPFSFVLYNELKNTKLELSQIKPYLGFIITSYVYSLSRTSSGNLDRLLIFPMFGFAILGNYSLGVQFLLLLVLLPQAVYQYVLPHDSDGNANRKIKIGTVVLSVILAIIGVTLAPFIIQILAPKFNEAIKIVQIVSLGIIPITINLMYISKYIGNTRIKTVTIGSGIYLLVQITAIFILGKIYGINGIAVALILAASTESVYLTCMNRISMKK